MNETFLSILFMQIGLLYFQNSIGYFQSKVCKYDPTTEAVVNALSFGYPTSTYGFYCVYDINEMDDEMENKNKTVSGIGWGDFLVFNLLLLLVIPTNCSITIRLCVAFGCIISVQLAELCNDFILHYSDVEDVPALPLPTIAVTAYAIVIDAIIEHFNFDCNYPLK